MKKLEVARATLAEIQQKIAELQGKRRVRLVAGDPAAVIGKLDDELAALRKAAQVETDRIALLEEEARKAEVEAVVRRRAGLINRFEKKLQAADAVAVELEASIAKTTELFHKVIAMREEARVALPASNSHIDASAGAMEGAAMSGAAVRGLLCHEFYRVSARPLKGGIPGERTVPSLPGSVCPRIEWQLQPEKIQPLATALRQASQFAVSLMKNEVDPQALLQTEAPAPAPSQPTTAESKLSQLLKLQMQLAADPSREAEYMAVVDQIAKASSEAEAAKGAAA
jgi:hypothetical protein